MKIAAGLIVAAFGVDIDRTVPPRHPTNRLARLEKFCVAIANATYFKAGKMDGVRNRCNGWATKRHEAYKKCGFYDANVKHGGPDPNVEYKATSTSHWGGPKEKVSLTDLRKRRDADCEWDGDESKLNYFMYTDMVEKERVRVQNDNPCAPNYIDSAWLGKAYLEYIQAEEIENCMEDCVLDNEESCEAQCTNFLSSRSGNSRLEMITRRGPFKSARSVVTGMRKWGDRYLAQCPGHRSGAHMKRRHNFMKTCVKKFVPHLCTHDHCADTSDGQDFRASFSWGGKNLKLGNPYLN